jgi:hypothetical protein
MHIFIDETGSFAIPAPFPSPSLVGALVIPDRKLKYFDRIYGRLRPKLPKDKGEVKGRVLNEEEIRSVVEVLLRCECLFEATVIELGTHTETGLTKHKMEQAKRITANLTEEHSSAAKTLLIQRKQELESSTLPQYVQTVVTIELIYRIINHATAYFCQRYPKELGAFHWVVDAKGRGSIATSWEKWWSFMMLPMLQTMFLEKPAMHLTWGDYTYFKRFEMEMPDYLEGVFPKSAERLGTNLRLLMTESFRFSSASEYGLEAVDIITNATRRALGGRLRKEGWGLIPQLMIHRKEHYLQFISMEVDREPDRQFPYAPVVREYRRNGRPMVAR